MKERALYGLLLGCVVACGGNLERGDAGAPNSDAGGPPFQPNDAGHTPDTPRLDGSSGGDDASTRPPELDAGSDAGEQALDAGPMITDPGTEGDGNHTIGPNYQDAPELTERDVPHGQVFGFQMQSADSAFYDGFDATLNNPQSFARRVDVYVPAQYVDGEHAPLMIVHDGPGYVFDVKTTLDNMIAAGELPAIVTVFLNHGGGDSIGSERGLEYDTLSDKYARFIEAEVLPAVLANDEVAAAYPNLAFTSHPEGRSAMGCSSGGAAAFTMGWFRPDLYRRIITYSGTFVAQQNPESAEAALYPRGAWEYHNQLIESSPVKPLRVFLQVGENDLSFGEFHNWPVANQRMADDLAAKGYHYRYVYSVDSPHCDRRVLKQTLPDTLRWMWRGYPLD